MSHENRIARSMMLALFAILVAVCGTKAQAASGDADVRELSRYTLTLADVRKYAAANEALAKLPKPAESEEETDSDEESDNAESLDDMVKRMDAVPGARKSIEGAGLTTRQYAVITMAIFQAAFAQFAIEQGADPAKVAKDAGVNPANIRFVKEHKAELEKLKKPGGED